MTKNSIPLTSQLLGLSACCFALVPLGAGAATTFTGLAADGGLVTTPGNWDNGVPDNAGNPGTITTGSATTYAGTGDLNFNGTWEGTSTLVGGNSRIDDGVLTFNDTSSYDAGGTTIALARDGGTGTININDSATVSAGNGIKIGRVGSAFVNQSGGSLIMGDTIDLGNTNNGGSGLYTFSGGTATATGLTFQNGTFDFTSGSTGILNILNGGVDYTTDFETFINGGQITLGGAAATTGDFQISFGSGVTSLQVIPEPSAAALGLLGMVGLLRRRR